MRHIHDATRKSYERRERAEWASVRRAERDYAKHLRGIAKQIGALFECLNVVSPSALDLLVEILERYALLIEPWAVATANRMLADVGRRDEAQWAKHSKTMSRELRKEIQSAPTGLILADLQALQVDLITSLPREAAQRVHALAQERMVANPIRANQLAADILRTGDVTVSRANLIARTETSRVASNLVQARAQWVGSEGYIWRTAGDSDVRPEHKILNGTFQRWDEPPVAAVTGQRAHPGCIWNCRCYAEPLVADTF